MALDQDRVNEAGTPEWWLGHLGRKLWSERGSLHMLHDYDRGDHPLPTGHARAREAYQRFQRQARTNFVGLVSDAVMDRLKVTGFRVGSTGDAARRLAGTDQEDDRLAQSIWQGNGLDAGIRPVFRDALVMRRAYLIVGPEPANDLGNGSGVLVTGEDPRQVIHVVEPTNRRRVKAALKTWTDESDGKDHAVVYLPERIYYFIGPKRVGSNGMTLDDVNSAWSAQKWDIDDSEYLDGSAPNPARPYVPVIPVINRPEKDPFGFGEFEDVLPVQDRINQGTLDRLTTAAAQSFRQRWATGVEFKDDQGRDTQPFDPGVDLMWHVASEEARFGDFQPTDLLPLLRAVKDDVEQLASVTRTPPYYLLGEMVNISGDALTAADTGATAKAETRQLQFGEALELMQQVAFRILGREAPSDIETIWSDAERRNAAKAADAAVKKNSVGVPWRQIMEDLGYTPAQIERMEVDRAKDRLQAILTSQINGITTQAALQPGQGDTGQRQLDQGQIPPGQSTTPPPLMATNGQAGG
jgi:Phage portal protein, SPP1 Gp6-like